MSSNTFLGVLLLALLTLLTAPTLSNAVNEDGECSFTDACTKEDIRGRPNTIFTDDCNNTYRITETCGLSRRCCFTDACSNSEKLCGEVNETLSDSCGSQFSIITGCGLVRRCCFTDACADQSLCSPANGTITNSCDRLYDVSADCKLSLRESDEDGTPPVPSASPGSGNQTAPQTSITVSPQAPLPTPSTQISPAGNVTEAPKRCCFRDSCTEEDEICVVDGVLSDSCGAVFDVTESCELTRRGGSENGTSSDPSQTPQLIDPTTQGAAATTPASPSTTPSSPPSPSQGPSNEDFATSITSEAVCIHSQHLAHLPDSALVFPRHVLAHILCDSSASCATPGHMVVYKGESMRMSGYCEIVGCQRKQGLVNSPRYSRGGRVESHSEDLVFTMLAARFETRLEEIVLAGLVRVGL